MLGGPDRFRYMSVQSVMTKEVFCVRDSDKVLHAWLALMEKDFSGAPVVDENDRLVGILSVTDIQRAVINEVRRARALGSAGDAGRDRGQASDEEELRGLSASVAAVAGMQVSHIVDMSSGVQALGTNDSLDRALKLMAEKSINRLPVLKEGRVVGIITREDILATLSGRKR